MDYVVRLQNYNPAFVKRLEQLNELAEKKLEFEEILEEEKNRFKKEILIEQKRKSDLEFRLRDYPIEMAGISSNDAILSQSHLNATQMRIDNNRFCILYTIFYI
jgi:hypothetical protein